METTFGTAGSTGVSLRRVLMLSLPALIVGSILRLSLLATIPEGYFGSDSNSYFVAAHALLLDGKISMPSKRRYIYPLLLIPAPLIPFCNTVRAVALAQHTLGLVTIFGIGWITAHLVRRPALWVPLVTLLAAVWPRMLYYEHEVGGETVMLAIFVAAVAWALPREHLSNDRGLFWFLLLAVLIMAVKPAGRPLWLGLVAFAAITVQRPWKWRWPCYATLLAAVGIGLTTGGEAQGPWLFLSSTLPFVKTEGTSFSTERAILRPAIERARADLPNYAFYQGRYKKMLSNHSPEGPLGPEYPALARDKSRFSRAAKTLGFEGIRGHPFEYLRLIGMKILVAATDDDGKRLVPAQFWADQNSSSEGRWGFRGDEMKLVYEMDEPAYLSMVKERAQRKIWWEPYLPQFRSLLEWLTVNAGAPGESPAVRVKWLGWLAIFGFAGSLLLRFRSTMLLWLPLLLYLGIIFAVGDRVSRYLLPIEWVVFVLIAAGLDAVLGAVMDLCKTRSAQPAATPAAA